MSKYLKSKRDGVPSAKSRMEESFNSYKSLLADKTHPDNHTDAYNKNIMSVLNRLLVSADELDEENPGEGIFGLIVLCLRTNLKLKDEIVKQEVQSSNLKKEILRLKKSR
jgi:hypothetical protein